jgi:hypothetical protein
MVGACHGGRRTAVDKPKVIGAHIAVEHVQHGKIMMKSSISSKTLYINQILFGVT